MMDRFVANMYANGPIATADQHNLHNVVCLLKYTDYDKVASCNDFSKFLRVTSFKALEQLLYIFLDRITGPWLKKVTK